MWRRRPKTQGGGNSQFSKLWKYITMLLLTLTLSVGQMWGDEVFTFSWTTGGVTGYCYSQAGPTGGALITNNAVYFISSSTDNSSKAPTVETINKKTYLNPQKTGFVFKPISDVTLSALVQTNDASRSCTIYVDSVSDSYAYAMYSGAGSAVSKQDMCAYILANAADDTEKQWWVDGTNGKSIKYSNNTYQAGTDSGAKKWLSGEQDPGTINGFVKRLGSSITSDLSGSEERTLSVKTGTDPFVFKAGKVYRVNFLFSSNQKQALKSFTFVSADSGGGEDPSCEATANAGADKETTVGVGVAMAATAAGEGYTGAWSIKAESPSTAKSQLGTASSNTMTFTPNTYGTYTLIWTVTSTSDGTCFATDEATVTVPAPTHDIEYTNTKGAANSNPAKYSEGTGIASFDKLRHVVGYDFTGWSPSSISSSATTNQTIEAQWTANAVAEGTGTLTYAFGYSDNTITSTITRNNGALYDATDLICSEGVTIDDSESAARSGKITTTKNYDSDKYLSLTFKIAEGYTFTPTEVQLKAVAVTTNKTIRFEFTDNAETPNTKYLEQVRANGSSVGDLTYDFDASDPVTLTGTVTVKIYAYGATDSWRLGTPITVTGTVSTPESSDCSAYEFHYGTKNQDNWETACFTQVGVTNEWRIADFAIPATTHYYVGYHGDGVKGWNSDWSAEKQWTDTYSDGNGAMVLLPGTSAVGQATNATGTLIIWSNSGDKNKYVGFKPNGYGITYGGSSYAFAATETEHALETEVVTLPDVSTTYTMGLATATEGTYVTCAHSAAEAISNMGVSNVGNGKKKIYLVPGSFDKNEDEEKYAIYDKTADKFDTDFMTDLDGDGVYEGYVSSTCASMILVRMSSEATTEELASKSWTHKWNQTTGDGIALSGTLAKKYTITSLNGDNCAYTEETVHPATGQKGVFRMWDNSGSQNWYVNFVPYYTLSYDGNGASSSTAATQRSSESSTLTVTVAANGFTAPTGHHFDHWNTANDNNGDSYAAGASYTLTSNATLYAIWAPNTHTLTWDFGEGGSTTSESYTAGGTVAYGTALVYPDAATMSREGYSFTGWSTDAATMPDENLTISAVWTKDCPTSGTVFSLSNVGSGYSNNSGAETELTDITITGGTAYGYGNSDRTISYNSNKIKYGGGVNYIKLALDCPLQAGDEITVACDDETGLNFNTNPAVSLAGNSSHPTYVVNGGTYEVKAEDGIIGESTIVCWRRADKGTNVTAITISRPIRYDVTYYKNDGTETSTFAEDVTKVAANEFVRSGYQFTGWNTDPAGEGTAYAVGASLSSDLSLYAQWEQLYTITNGSPDHGTVEADKESAVAGATITLTANPASGYKLSAWDVYKTGDASTKVSVTNNQFTMPAYGVTISAEFVESVVLYDYSVMAAAGNKSFTGEDAGSGGENKDKTFGTEGNPQLIIKDAGWDSKGNINNCFIKYFSGTSSMSVVIPAGRKATVVIKYGSYDKDNKYLKVNGVAQAKPLKALDNSITTENFDTYMRTVELTNQTGTLVLTSQSNNSGNNIYFAYVDVTLTGNASYNVTYHLNDGAWDGDAGAATYTYGTGIASLATNVTKNGYDFVGWYGNEGLTGDAITSIATTATGDKAFWAKWKPKSYTLTWSWNGGSCSGEAGTDYTAGGSVAYGAAINYPDATMMSKDDAAFAGWSSTPATMPAEALTITAQWAPEHAITYKETKGATNTNPETYVQGVGVASFAPLADVANFHFTGWSPTSIGTDATEDMDVTAQWVAAYNVTFSAGEGSGTVPATFQKWATATFELPGQGDMVAPAGKVFIGWKANGAGETRAEGYEYTMTAAAVEFVAQWKAVTLLINYDGVNYSLNTTDFQTGVELVDGVAGYAKQAKFGNTTTSVTGIDALNKGIIYHTKTNATKVTITAYNNYGSNSTSTFHYSVVAEGVTSTPSVTNKTLNKFTGDSYEINMTGRSTLYIMTSQKELRICQVEIEENGTANKVAPEVEYSVNLNKQRPFLPAEATTFEGITYRGATSYKPVNGQVQISTCGTDYYSFTIPEGQTRQLQLTTSNTNKYTVSKTLGDAENQYQPKANNETKNWNLTAGTWYINPQGSNVNITTIAFDETPDPITVIFKDGLSTLSEQALFAGDKVTAPTAPVKSGYRFVEWQKSGVAYDFTTELVAGDAPGFTLDAVWQKVWTVTFNSDGGTAVDPQVVDDGGVATLPDPAPEKAGHSLVRWYKVTGEEGQEEIAYSFSTDVTADMTLKALWHELQNDPSLSALSYDGNTIELSSGVESEGLITYTYELPYKGEYDAAKLSVTKAASSATLSDITYTPATKTASFSVTTVDGPVVQNYAVVFTNAPKDQLCLVWAEMKGNGVIELDEAKSALSINVAAGPDVKSAYEYGGYTGYKFSNAGSAYIALEDGDFKSGDKVDVFITKKIDAVIPVFKANEATEANRVAVTDENMNDGVNTVSLTADAASLYLRRGEDYNGWNPYVAYMAVYRAYPVPVVKTITFNGAAGVIDGTTITATIPYTTDMASLPIEATFMSNDPGNTTGDVGGPWIDNDGVYTNSYVVTDKDGDTNTYIITLTRAEVSHDASLTALAVEGYEISFDPATLSYDVQLPYGATVGDIPAVTYTAAAGATADKTDAAEMPGYTTIAVTAEDESTVQEYSIYFHANQIPTFAVFDGRTMDAAVVEYTDATSQLRWTSADASTSSSGNTKTINGRTYTKSVKIFGSATAENRYLKITVPENYMAKFYLAGSTNSSSGSETLFFANEITADKTKAIAGITASVDDPTWVETDYLFPDEYYFCVTGSARLYELSVTLYSIDYTRNVTAGRLGTICLPHGGTMRGAAVYEVAYFNPENNKIYYDEVLSGEMEPGMPYIFLPDEGNNDKLVVMYGNNVPAAVAGHNNGLYGYFSNDPEESYNVPKNAGNYIISENKYWYVDDDITYVPQNRAYLRVTEMIGYNGEPAPTPAYGRRRVVMDAGAQAPQVTTGVDEINASEKPVKLMIKGQIYILRGEKMYDVTGKVVK